MQNFYPNPPQYGYQMNNGGYAYSVARPQPSNSQPLTQDIVNTLRQESNEFNMKVDQRDLWRAMCTHRDPSTGASTLTYNADGTCTCSICGETFTMFDGNTKQIEDAIKTLTDMFQTCKTIYLDAPTEMTKQYYQMIVLLRKFPGLWDLAVKNFAKYENTNNPLNPISNSYGSGFNALNTLLTNPYAMQGMYQQPMMGAQMPVGYAPNSMAMNNQMPMGYNPMMMNGAAFNPAVNQQMMPNQVPMQAMDPNNNPMGFNANNAPVPNMPTAQNTQQVASAPSTQNNEVQQQKVYNV